MRVRSSPGRRKRAEAIHQHDHRVAQLRFSRGDVLFAVRCPGIARARTSRRTSSACCHRHTAVRRAERGARDQTTTNRTARQPCPHRGRELSRRTVRLSTGLVDRFWNVISVSRGSFEHEITKARSTKHEARNETHEKHLTGGEENRRHSRRFDGRAASRPDWRG